ncbi:MAG: pseudouridine-5'-phosphate glycosidase [Sphingobacteriales bacterium]|nr:pseudouridine-5'-phosphate glycosidase [Sphingobacteriales bacterium]
MHPALHLSEEVQLAMQSGQAVVALESTIIAHGMPWPKNVETAREVEQIVRDQGAVPATIALLDGKIHVGLDNQQLDLLGNSKSVWKVSLRDLPYVISRGLHGATTVAATMRIAALAGIRVFVTGGIGGVHRGAEHNMDISADLTEMSRTNVAVVSAGVKSILDIGLTLEVLETLGVPVVTFGSDDFPSFYSRKSGHTSPLRLDDAPAIAAMLRHKWDLGLEGAVLIGNPVPAAYEVPYDQMEEHIRAALTAAEQQGVKGKEITPFLLRYLAVRTGGESLDANIALVKNNAKLGAQVAVAL